MYGGYVETPEEQGGSLKFGLNERVFMTKFEFNANGGKDGAPQDCLDITFNINGTEKSYRQFPVTRAYNFMNEEVLAADNPKSPFIQASMLQFTNNLIQVIECFADSASVKAALSRPITSFKQYVDTLRGLLPGNFAEIPLDIFLQWEFQPKGNNDRTYLQIPSKTTKFYVGYAVKRKGRTVIVGSQKVQATDTILLKDGTEKVYAEGEFGNADRNTWTIEVSSIAPEHWIGRAMDASGSWKAMKADDDGLYYEDEEQNVHKFKRSAWFMGSNFAHAQNSGSTEDSLNKAADNNGGSGKTGW